MRYLAFVTDYDGTLASDGQVAADTVLALQRIRLSGRRTILVTGRRLDELLAVFPRVTLFDSIVAENGALVYSPRTKETVLLGKPPPPAFVQRLKQLGVEPIEVGRVIVATWLPHHTLVLQAIQEMGLELLIIFNKSAVMILPTGVNKATGLDYALRKLGLSFHEAVGIGDAENDHSFMERCECAVAVANAVPSIRQLAAFVTQGRAGEGLTELVDELIADDLTRLDGHLPHNLVTIGMRADETAVTIFPYRMNILIAGPSGSGKSTITAGIVERLIDRAYQVCVVDPEGDYGTMREVITLGDRQRAASLNEILSILEDPKSNLNVNLLGVALAERPEYFAQLFTSLRGLRTRTGRPHWIVLDEAHHFLPLEWVHCADILPRKSSEMVLVTVHPDHLPPPVLAMIDVVIAIGATPEKTLRNFSCATGHALTWPKGLKYTNNHAVAWFPGRGDCEPPFSMRIIAPRHDRIRHRRKYAEGNMHYHSFYFRGPENRHNLRAQNLTIFSQIAEGIDEQTWLFHLYRSDYSRWFRDAVKDPYLADQAARIEQRRNLHPEQTRHLMRRLIESRYTLPD